MSDTKLIDLEALRQLIYRIEVEVLKSKISVPLIAFFNEDGSVDYKSVEGTIYFSVPKGGAYSDSGQNGLLEMSNRDDGGLDCVFSDGTVYFSIPKAGNY